MCRLPGGFSADVVAHAPTSVTDMYALGLRKDESRRREWCERVGLGFNLFGDLGYMGYKSAQNSVRESRCSNARNFNAVLNL